MVLIILLIQLILGIGSLSFNFKPDLSLQKIINPVNSTQDQWTGGDCSCSTTVKFGDEEYDIYFYADTTIGKVLPNGTRSIPFSMIHNSVGIYQKGRKNEDHIQLFWKNGPESFFVSKNSSVYFWSSQAISLFNEKENSYNVYVFLFRTLKDRFLEGDGMTIAEMIVRKDNLFTPLQWNVSYHQIPFDISSNQNGFDWGGEALTLDNQKNYLYIWGRQGKIPYPMLSRMKITDFRNFDFPRMEFWCESREWVELSTTPFEKLKLEGINGLHANSEAFLIYHEYLKKYIQISIPDFMGTEVYAYISDEITGPYDVIPKVWTIPAPWSTTQGLYVYAIKSHQYLCEKENEIVFTYNANCFSCDWPQLEDVYHKLNEFYIPQYVRVSIKN